MAKLHELLAVESNLKTQAAVTIKSTLDLFDKKERHFSAVDAQFRPLAETGATEVVEKLDMQTTVRQELGWLSEFLSKVCDVIFQVDCANQSATADVVLEDGTVLASGIPATTLLELEKEIRTFQNVIKMSKTLDPTKGFQPDVTHTLANVYRARDTSTHRTAKIQEPLVLAPATDKHAAQVQLVSKDVIVGHVHKSEWSGLMTPHQKADMIDRCEQLIRAVRKARSRANEQEIDVSRNKIGSKLYQFILG